MNDVEKEFVDAMGLKDEDCKEFVEWAISLHDSCTEFLNFAITNQKVKVSQRQIPPRVSLPKAFRKGLEIRDIQVGGKRREPDDKIYSQNKKIRDLIARGNTLLKFRRDGRDVLSFPLYGMKKFTGGMGDDDDQEQGGDNVTWQKFFTKPSETASHLISTSKENGSAGHLSAICIDGEYVLIGGSKNSHLIVSLEHGEEDINLYPSSPWKVAKLTMKAIFRLFNQIGKENTMKFIKFIADWHLTAIFETLDPEDQHIELLTNEEPEVRFITFTAAWKGDSSVNNNNQLCMYPLHAVNVAKSYGIPTIKCEVVQLPKDESERKNVFAEFESSVRLDFGNEGRVLYFATDDKEVIGLLKKKTVWYIMLRALREKYKLYQVFVNQKQNGKKTRYPTLEAQKNNIDGLIKKRFKEIQSWLGFSNDCLNEWTTLGLNGSDWVYNKIKSNSSFADKLKNTFPVIWNQFLTETEASDKISTK